MFDDPAAVDAVAVERVPLWNDRRDEHGPFDVIGDVHGCYDELVALLDRLECVFGVLALESEPVDPRL